MCWNETFGDWFDIAICVKSNDPSAHSHLPYAYWGYRYAKLLLKKAYQPHHAAYCECIPVADKKVLIQNNMIACT